MRGINETTDFNLEFGAELQTLLIGSLLQDSTSFALCRNIISEEYFDDHLRPAVRYVLEYSDEYKKMPAPALVSAKSGVRIEGVFQDAMPERWLLEEVERFARYKALENAIYEGAKLLEKGRGGEVEKLVKAAMTISLMKDLGTDYFEDPEARLKRLHDQSAFIGTGWHMLDRKLGGGVTRGGLNVFAGGSGAGKSLILQNLALNWTLAGYNVVYLSLELNEDLISQRIDAMMTGKSTKYVYDHTHEIATMIALTGKKAGTLRIKKLPQGGTTANDMRAYLREYQIKTGVKPDAVLVDYLDLLYPGSGKIDPSDLFVKDKYVAEELRGMMGELDVFGATASQFNRSAVQTQEFDHSHIAGGISKVNTADNLVGLLSTPSMKEKGVYQLQFLKTRVSSATGSRIDLDYDPTSMRISDPAITEDVDEPKSRAELKRDLGAEQPEKPKQETHEFLSGLKGFGVLPPSATPVPSIGPR